MSWRSRGVMSAARRKAGVRIVALLVLLWLIIGAIAAGQRHCFSGGNTNCAKVGTITATILGGAAELPGGEPKDQVRGAAAEQITRRHDRADVRPAVAAARRRPDLPSPRSRAPAVVSKIRCK